MGFFYAFISPWGSNELVRQIKNILVLIFLCSVLAGAVHLWISDRLGVMRSLYPLEALITQSTFRCSEQAPKWMYESLRHALWEEKASAGQLAYVSSKGHVHTCNYGWRSRFLFSTRVDDKTRFRYASMTKLLTADAVLRQVELGRLNLHARLLDLLPEVVDLKDKRLADVTIEQLLRHSAGFDRLVSIDTMVVHKEKPWCPYDISQLAKIELDFNPGERYAYSNLNYCLLGVVLERVSGNDFRAFINGEYGLKGRGILFVDGDYLPDEVRYDFRNSNFYSHTYWRYFDFNALSSSAGLSGSASALAELLKELSQEQKLLVTTAHIPPGCRQSRLKACYGYAVYRYRPGQERLGVHVQPGFLYGSPSVAMLDDNGGVIVWVGSGMRLKGVPTNSMVKSLYRALNGHYDNE